LAPSNKSRAGSKATKPQRTIAKPKDGSDDDFAQAFGLETAAPIATRHRIAASQKEEGLPMKYKYHDENSPRGFVHLVFDLYGENAARALGGHLPLEPVTVEQYVREFKTLADLARDTDRRWRRGSHAA
jgi:hypothetical protein